MVKRDMRGEWGSSEPAPGGKGDGFMASFGSATKALECATAMQPAFAEHNESAEEPITARVGLNAGEPIAEDEDLFGTAGSSRPARHLTRAACPRRANAERTIAV